MHIKKLLILSLWIASNIFCNQELFNAVIRGDINRVQSILNADTPVNINLQDKYGYTALMIACIYKKVDIAQLLIASGAKLNLHDTDGNTALIWALTKGKLDIAALLVLSGADKTTVTKRYQQSFLQRPILQFARNLRECLFPKKADQTIIPNHENIETAFYNIYYNAEHSNDEKLIANFLQQGWDPTLAIELSLSLETLEKNFAINHFNEIYKEYKRLTGQ